MPELTGKSNRRPNWLSRYTSTPSPSATSFRRCEFVSVTVTKAGMVVPLPVGLPGFVLTSQPVSPRSCAKRRNLDRSSVARKILVGEAVLVGAGQLEGGSN